jgi:hypothetical protein
MANHANPTTASTYANYTSELDTRIDDVAAANSTELAAQPTNLPTYSVRWNHTAFKWQKNTGTAGAPTWSDLAAAYSININGTVGATTPSTGAFTTITTTGSATLGAASTVAGSTIVSLSATQTLTNKTLTTPVISVISNSGNLTLPTGAQNLVGTTSTDTLSNKTLTAPKIANAGFIADANGNEALRFVTTASAVNDVQITNSATGADPTISAVGDDTNVGLNLVSKGTGIVKVNGTQLVYNSGTWNISVSGNAATVTNGVYTTGNQTIDGTKTFSSTITASITGNAGTVTNGVYRTSATGSAGLPVGTTAQRDGSPVAGYIRLNSSLTKFEGFNGTAWGPLGGGATGSGGDEVFQLNAKTVTTSYTVPSDRNAHSVGPITISDGQSVTIPDGSRWVIS